MKVTIITAGKDDGLTTDIPVLPNKGDTFELDFVEYSVYRVLHKVETPVLRGSEEPCSQRIALVLERI